LYNFVLFYHYCYHHYVVNKDFQFNSMQWGVGRAFLCPAPHVITRHTLWQGTKFSVFFSLSVTDISATVAPICVKFCMMYRDQCRTGLLRLWGDAPTRFPSAKFWA